MFKEGIVGRKRFQLEQTISKLREAEVLGETVGQVCPVWALQRRCITVGDGMAAA